ncbi:MAG: IclR family transcriptional regulator [Clostridiales Family XIII bacterium]|jgi:DNA-binding IclR family transcriptional regulator|nr:IclR family transcriptional regulator [Clostridiales Family XIII bacterium]
MAIETDKMNLQSSQQPTPSQHSAVQSVERALDILEALSIERRGLGVTEIATQVGLHKSTAHRLLSTLIDRGYAEKNADGIYRLGIKPIEVVSVYINSLELQTEARPYVAQISAELGLTSHLGVLEGDQVVYIERFDMYSGIRLYTQIGLRVNAYCSSLGKCLLSNFNTDQLDKILANCSFNKFTPNTISTLKDFHEEMKKVRRQGWAMDNQEFDLNNRCIGAPIYDYRGEIIAAISASGTPIVLPENRIEEVAAYVMEKASLISRSLGYVE